MHGADKESSGRKDRRPGSVAAKFLLATRNREAAPKHASDEEESLFPRLRQVHHPNIQSALTRLDSPEEAHRRAALLHSGMFMPFLV